MIKDADIRSVYGLRPRRFKGLEFRELINGDFLGNLSLFHMRLPPRKALPNVHHRRTEELVYCLSGSMTATIGDRKERVRKGSAVYIPKGVWHKFETGASACEALAIFGPALSIDSRADIHGEPGVRIWD